METTFIIGFAITLFTLTVVMGRLTVINKLWVIAFFTMFIGVLIMVMSAYNIGKKMALKKQTCPKQIQITYDLKDSTMVPVDTTKIY